MYICRLPVCGVLVPVASSTGIKLPLIIIAVSIWTYSSLPVLINRYAGKFCYDMLMHSGIEYLLTNKFPKNAIFKDTG